MTIKDSIAGIPLRSRLIAGGLVFAVATIVAYWQYAADYEWHERYSVLQWLWHPVDWNVDAGLPDIANINAVQVVNSRPWIAGNGAFLAFGDSDGVQWTRVDYNEQVGRFAIAPTASTAQTAAWRIDGFLGTPVYAAGGEQAAQQAQPKAPQSPSTQQRPPIRQGPPVEQKAPAPNAPAPSADIAIVNGYLVASPKDVDFGTVRVGSSSERTVTIENPSAGVTPGSVGIRQPRPVFGVEKNGCPFRVIEPGQRCEILISFRPTAAGRYDAVVVANEQLATLHGVGAPVPESKSPAPPPVTPTPPKPAVPGGGEQPTKSAPSKQGLDLVAFANCSGMHCELASRGNWFATDDGGTTWTFNPARTLPVPAQPSRIVYESPGGRAWRLQNDALARSDDGGNSWVPLNRKAAAAIPGHAAVAANAQYWSFIPPWYLLAALLIGLFVSVEEHVVQRLEPDAEKERGAIAPQGTADKPLEPGEPDALELNALANGIGFFLSNRKTKPPLVIAVNGRWGSGKSSLMNLVRRYLESNGSRPVSFNAWHHQKEDQLLAALLDAVKAQAVPTLASGSGWMFRARLAAERLRHAWFEAALAAGVLVLLWYAELYLQSRFEEVSVGHLIHVALTSSFFTGDTLAAQGLMPLLKFIEGWTATAGALLFTVTRAARGIRAFASNPSSLLASDAPGSTAKRLQEQTAFRQQFAREFGDVTRALGRQRMLILIDDLDRCRPEKVREVLEAVNFLVSSGECFVILGMAREIVRHCVGLSFARVVDTMPWDAFDLPRDEIHRIIERTEREFADAAGGKKQPDISIAARRAAFAELFLDKLVQIEISVPEPSSVQKKKLFETKEQRTKQVPDAERRAARWLKGATAAANFLQPILYGAVVAGAVIALGLQMGRGLGNMIERSKLPQMQADFGGNGPARSEGSATAPPGAPTTPTRPNTGNTPGPVAYLIVGAPKLTGMWYSPWPFALAIATLLSVMMASLRRMPQQPVEDLEVFTAAMQIWHPLVLTSGARNTPRTARRFQNRVRYLALRQRALTLPPQFSLGARLVRRIAGVGRAPETPRTAADSGEVLQVLAAARTKRIPEDMLVALAAIHEFAPEWLANLAVFNTHLVQEIDNPAEVSDAITHHKTGKLFSWDSAALASYRGLYLHLTSEVDRSQAVHT